MNCPECGTYVATGMRMCPICHTELVDTEATTQTLVPPVIIPVPIWANDIPQHQFSFGDINTKHLKLAIAALLVIASITTVIGASLIVHQTATAQTTGSPNSHGGKGIATLPVANATVALTATPTASLATATTIPGTGVVFSYDLNCGGYQNGSFLPDTNGNPQQNAQTSDSIDISHITNPAPQNVYQTERTGDSTYTISVKAGLTYKVRLHFAEIHFDQPGQRQFDVYINQQRVLQNFDIVAEADGSHKAIVREFTATPDNQGKITLRFLAGAHNEAKCSGFEIISVGQ